MHRLVLLIILGLNFSVHAQNSQNPFDLSSPASTEEKIIEPPTTEKNKVPTHINPFDLENKTPTASGNEEKVPDETATNSNPFDLNVSTEERAEKEEIATTAVTTPSPPKNIPPLEEIQNSDGWVMSISLSILALATFIFIFFRSLYGKVYKAILNDNQLNLLFREKTGGTIGSFYIAYALFFLSTGLFIYLTLIHFNLLDEGNTVKQYSMLTASFTGLFIFKHLVLSIIGYVFPIRKEIRLYSFSIMVFAIILGIILPFADFILAYSTENSKAIIIYLIGAFIVIVYFLRSIRSLFIANRFIFSYPFHFLLYLCAVEIAPVLILYKIISNI